MNIRNRITIHEAYDLRQLLTMKNVCVSKSYAMSKLVKDEELKAFMLQDLESAKGHIKVLETLVQTAPHTAWCSDITSKPVQTSRFAASDVLNEVKDKEVPIKSGAKNRAANSRGGSL